MASSVWLIMVGPPAAPSARIGFPSFNTTVGLMLESGRLPAATALASAPIKPKKLLIPGWIEKSSIWLFITTPVPGITTFEPKLVFTVAVQATQLPWASAIEKCVVCFLKTSVCQSGGRPCDGTSDACSSAIPFARFAA